MSLIACHLVEAPYILAVIINVRSDVRESDSWFSKP